MRTNFVDRYITDRVVISGNKIERLSYSCPIKCDYDRGYIIKKDREKNSAEGKRQDNLSRARQNVRRIIWANLTPHTKFLTLTSAETLLDVKEFRRKQTTFFQSMKRSGYDLEYLYVLERQKERGLKEGNEGTIHSHIVIFNDEYIPFEIINKCWKWGSTDIHVLNELKYDNGERVKDLGAYVCKYLTKEAELEWGSRSYNCSKNLKRPIDYPLKSYGSSDVGYFQDPEDPVIKITEAFERNANFYYYDSRLVQYMMNYDVVNQIIDYKQGIILSETVEVNFND